jgi:hypothetical protein
MHFSLIIVVVCILFAKIAIANYNGILMIGHSGFQIYDPLNTPHAIGNLQIQPENRLDVLGMVINGNLVYFLCSELAFINCYSTT